MATPFHVMVGRAAMIAGGSLTREAMIDNARAIQEQAEEVVRLLDRLSGVGVPEPELSTACDVRHVLRETERWLGTFAPELESRVVIDSPEDAKWVGDEHTPLLALVLLCEVAAETCSAPHALRVHVRRDPTGVGNGDTPLPGLFVALEWPSDRIRELSDAASPSALLESPHPADVPVSVALVRQLARLHGGDLVVDPLAANTARCVLRWPLASAR